jgi:Actinobacteria/chloroflexi VLRF1 release factor
MRHDLWLARGPELRIAFPGERCVMTNGPPASARWLEVTPGRLPGWLAAFADRHDGAARAVGASGEPEVSAAAGVATFRAADGAVAECHVPFPPLPPDGIRPGEPSPGAVSVAALAGRLAGHALADRMVGVLLVRLGGYAAGVFAGPDQQLIASKVGSRLVHGRSAAGGQSQRRFARRREKQASEALLAAADTAAAVLGPYAGRLDAVVLGGDKRAMAGLEGDVRLRPFLALAVDRFLTVPDPRLAVLRGTPRMYRAIRIRLTEPPA